MKKRTRAIVGSLLLLLLHARADDGQFTVLQWNIWQEGTKVPGGYEAIADEIARLQPDFVTLSETRNYDGTRFCDRITASLAQRGLTYYSFYSYDSGLLSKHPITDSTSVFPENNDHGSIYRLTAQLGGRTIAVYTAHLDYQDCAYYNVRGYDGSTWEECERPASVKAVLRRNKASKRDDAIRRFLAHAKQDLKENAIVILGGDFNEPSHLDWTEATKNLYDHHGMVVPWTVTRILERHGYTDAYRQCHPDPLTHPGFTYPSDNELMEPDKLTWAPKSDERERIDYIFYQGKDVNVGEAVIFGPEGCIAYNRRTPNNAHDTFIEPLGTWPTDHKGVWATFHYEPAGK